MKVRIQKVCLLRKNFEALPAAVRMIIENDGISFKDDATTICFELVVGTVRDVKPGAGMLYTNTYFCDRDQVEWRLTGCDGSETDCCPDCGRPLSPLMSEVGRICDFSEASLRRAFENR